MKRILVVAVGAVTAAACSESGPVDPTAPTWPRSPNAVIATGDLIVTSSNDGGPGSFRAAIAQANGNAAIQTIAFHPSIATIPLQSSVLYTGSQNLTIHGNNATLDGAAAGGPAFRMNTLGADLTLTGLTVRNSPSHGVQIEVDPLASGTVAVRLVDVHIIENLGHGVLVNDQLVPETQDGVQPDARGSAASLHVTVLDSRFIGNGFSVSDRDGLRVNEGGSGDLTLVTERTRAERNGADGIEIDERGAGNVHIDVATTHLVRNGMFDPADLDDGFDIDEYNDGGIIGAVVNSSANQNFEEGFDFNENNAGDLRVDFTDVEASENGEEGLDLEEDDDFGSPTDPNGGGGDLVTVMTRIRTFGNGPGADGALKIREKQSGNLSVTLTDVRASHNRSTGIFVRETGAGDGSVSIDRAVSTSNEGWVDGEDENLGHGIEIREGDAGTQTSTVTNSTVSANAGFGVNGTGSGSVTATNVQGAGNALGLFGGIVIN